MIAQPDTKIFVNETEDPSRYDCSEAKFDVREMQNQFDGKRIKVFRCGEKLYAKIDDDCKTDCEEIIKGTMQSEFKLNKNRK